MVFGLIAIDLRVGAASANVRIMKDVTTMPKKAAAAAPACVEKVNGVQASRWSCWLWPQRLSGARGKRTLRFLADACTAEYQRAASPITLVLLLGAAAAVLWTAVVAA